MNWMKQMVMLCALLFATEVGAAALAGRDYKRLEPAQPVSSGDKIEVLEFFFYGCSHCFHLHPYLSAWEKKMPKDVVLRHVPVIFRDSWEPMARTFYALEALGQLPRLHDALFNAWHDDVDLTGAQQAAEFVAQHGVDRTRFRETYDSFSVTSKVNRSIQMLQSYQIRGTPTLVVDGKYVITGLQPADMIRTLNEVIEIARKERGKE